MILATLATALFATGSAVANDPQWQAIDNHHGAYLYFYRPAPTQPTIAFTGHSKALGSSDSAVRRIDSIPMGAKLSYREVATPHGAVGYFAPVE